MRRDGRVAEGARLESVFILTGNVGSNPTLSAILASFGSTHSMVGHQLKPLQVQSFNTLSR